MSAPDIKILLSALGIEQVMSAMRKVQGEVRKMGEEAKRSTAGWGSLKQVASEFSSGILPQLGAAAAGAALLNLGRQAFNLADAMDEASQKTAVSVETLSALKSLPDAAGEGFDKLTGGLIKFNRFLANVQSGSKEARSAVEDLFGTATALDGLDTEQAFLKLATAIGKMPDSAKKTDLAIKAFGKSGAELIPLLNDLSEKGFDKVRQRAQELGIIMSSDMAAAAAKAKDAMTDLGTSVQGAAMQFMSGLAPAIQGISEALVDATRSEGVNGLQKVGELVGDVARGIVSAFLVVGKVVGTVLAGLSLGLEQYFARFKRGLDAIKSGSILSGGWELAKAGSGVTLVKDLADGLSNPAIWKGLGTEIQESMLKVWRPDLSGGSSKGGSAGTGTGPAADRAGGAGTASGRAPRQFDLTEFDRQEMERAAALDREILAQQKAILDDAYKMGKVSLADYYDTKIQLARQSAQIEESLALAEVERLQAKQAASADEYEQAQLQLKINDLLAQQELERLRLTGEIAAIERERGAAVADRTRQQAEQGRQAFEEMTAAQNEFRASLEQGATNVLNRFLTDTIFQAKSAGDAFKQFGMAVVSTLQQIITQMLVMQMVKAMFGAFGGGMGPGNVMSGSVIPLLPAMAEGGIITGGTPGVDSVPIMTMPGEGVLRTSAMNRIGAGAFHDLNEGRAFVVRGRSMPRFADGGIVGGAGAQAVESASIDGAVTVGLEDGLVMRALESTAAGRLVVKHLSKQPKAANQALGRR